MEREVTCMWGLEDGPTIQDKGKADHLKAFCALR